MKNLAIITGASRGIGLELARQLGEAGTHDMLVHSLNDIFDLSCVTHKSYFHLHQLTSS